jgi:hypothetical protein
VAQPPGLFSSASPVVIAGIFGRYSDKRELEDAIPVDQTALDFSHHNEPRWLDYIADLGDGWDSTYANRSSPQPGPGGLREPTHRLKPRR